MEKKLKLLIFRYFFFGVIAVVNELTFFNLAIKYFHYIIANTIAYGFGIITSFLLNAFYNFNINNNFIVKFFRFIFINICGLIISNFFLYIFSNLLPLFYLKIISMPFIILFKFLLNYFWTFKND